VKRASFLSENRLPGRFLPLAEEKLAGQRSHDIKSYPRRDMSFILFLI
jgi:hypothetical protein